MKRNVIYFSILLSICCFFTGLTYAQEENNIDNINNNASTAFNDAYDFILKADVAKSRKNYPYAYKMYRNALNAYILLARKYPDVEPEVVNFRISYCNGQIVQLVKKNPNIIKLAKDAHPIVDKDESLDDSDVGMSTGLVTENVEPVLDLKDVYHRASKYIIDGNPENAMRLLLKALLKSPDDIKIKLLMAQAQVRAGRYSDALSMADDILKEDRKNMDIYFVIAASKFAQGDYKAAENAMMKVIKQDNSMEANFNMAQILLNKDNPEKKKAKKYYNKAIKLGLHRDPEIENLLKK